MNLPRGALRSDHVHDAAPLPTEIPLPGTRAAEGVPAESRTADEKGMRTSHVVTVLAAFTAGLTAAAALRRRAGNRRPLTPTVTRTALPVFASIPDHDAVVLPFARPIPAERAPEQLSSPTHCGDSGGRTKTGAPCGARTIAGGRCHHHPMAA